MTAEAFNTPLRLSHRGAAQAVWKPFPVTRFTLSNGLRVILLEDQTLPLVAVSVTYNVGADDEPPSQDGMAHLVEHMMFKGSVHVADGEQYELVAEAGGYTAGLTGAQTTVYNTTIPANQLEMGLYLEADRMRNLRVTGEGLASQKLAVKNETEAGARSELPSKKIAQLTNAYRLLVRDITVDDVTRFYSRYYGPNNAVLSISGDIKARSAEALVRRHFSSVPRADLTREQHRPSAARETFTDFRRNRRAVFLAYPAQPTRDGFDIAPMAVEYVRTGLRQTLAGAPVNVDALLRSQARKRYLVVFADVPDGRTADEVEASLSRALRALSTNKPSEDDVERLKRRTLLAWSRLLLNASLRGETAAEFELLHGDGGLINQHERWIRSLQPSDLTKWVTSVVNRTPAFVLLAEPASAKGTK